MVRIRLKEKAHEKVDGRGGWLLPAAMDEYGVNGLVRTLGRAGAERNKVRFPRRNGVNRL